MSAAVTLKCPDYVSGMCMKPGCDGFLVRPRWQGQTDNGEDRYFGSCPHGTPVFNDLTPSNEKPTITKTHRLPSTRKGSGLRGTKTNYQAQQLKAFKTFIEAHPITPSQKVNARARQCWLQYQKEWDKAAEEKRGYVGYKTLARAYRNS